MNLLLSMATYLAEKLEMTLAADIFYYEMPDTPDTCVCIYEDKNRTSIPPQLDVEERRISIVARSDGNTSAEKLASKCYRWLLTDNELYDTDRELVDITGFIQLGDESVYVTLHSVPVWNKVDQQGRKYFSFDTTIITSRR